MRIKLTGSSKDTLCIRTRVHKMKDEEWKWDNLTLHEIMKEEKNGEEEGEMNRIIRERR